MKINKQLKNVSFEYDENKKSFTIMEADGFNGYIELNKVEAFAFMRFVVRMAQRNWLRNKKPLDKNEDSTFKSKNQMEIF
jgi:hypothetical protein